MATQKKFVVKNGLIASDLSYPTSDGTANQPLVTDGAGNLSFGTLSTSTVTEGSNLYYTDARADARAALIVDAAPSTLDTLNELAAALGDDANFSTTVTNSIANKLPLAGGTMTGNLRATTIDFGDASPTLSDNGDYLKIQTTHGYTSIGAGNTYNTHFYTDRDSFYFNKKLLVDDGEVQSYDEDLNLNRAGSTTARLRIASGTTYSDQAFQVTGTVTSDQYLYVNSPNGTQLQLRSEDAYTTLGAGNRNLNISANRTIFLDDAFAELMRIQDDGKVGIGTNGPASLLDVMGVVNVGAGDNISPSSSSAGQLRINGSGYDGFIALDGTGMNIGHNSSVRAFSLHTNETPRLTILAAGNVGIGTATPATTLHVRGTASTVGANRSVVTLTDDTSMGINVGSGIAFRGLYTSAGGEANYGGIFAGKANANSGNANGYLSLSYSASGTLTEGVRISESGNVGIGTTAPGDNLEVYQGSTNGGILLHSTTADSYIKFENDTNSWFVSHDGNDNSGSNNSLQISEDGVNTRFMVAVGGNVGIGTATPATLLHIASTGSPQLRIQDNDLTNDWATIGHNNGLTAISSRNNAASGSIAFRGINSNAEFMRIISNGNVGIGTATPLHPLHVEGTIYSTNNIQLNSTKQVTFGNSYQYIKGTNNTSIEIGTGGTTTITATHAGNVGIGTTAPGENLEVYQGSSSGGILLHSTTADSYVKFENDTNSWYFSHDGNNNSGSNNSLQISEDGVNTRFMVAVGGNVGIGTSNPTERLHVSGNILATGNITAYSDISLKDNITPIPNALDKVLQIRGVTYNRNDVEDNPRHTGVIAQEVEKVLPEVISENEDGIKSVAYGNMVGLLVEAIKELKAEIEELKGK